MSDVVDVVMMELEESMEKSESSMRGDLAAIRTGKASPALVEGLMVDYYGTMTRLRDMAQIAAPEPRLLTIQPWDASAVKAIEKAIMKISSAATTARVTVAIPTEELYMLIRILSLRLVFNSFISLLSYSKSPGLSK